MLLGCGANSSPAEEPSAGSQPAGSECAAAARIEPTAAEAAIPAAEPEVAEADEVAERDAAPGALASGVLASAVPGDARVGVLSRSVIRDVIRVHIGEVRACYEAGLRLARRRDLEGRVTASFVIGATGRVQIASVASSSIGDAEVEQCIVSAVKSWEFPAPDGGGVVGVNYPFVLSNSEPHPTHAE